MKTSVFPFFINWTLLLFSLNLGVLCAVGTLQASTVHYEDNFEERNYPPIANNDTFLIINGCGLDLTLSGNILANDMDPNGDQIAIRYYSKPLGASFHLDNNSGEFDITLLTIYSDTIIFEYYIYEKTEKKFMDNGLVVIYIQNDNDCDGIANNIDLDDDNDGLLDTDEGDGKLDSDQDGVPNSYDIDSDNDGITDNHEWQKEGHYLEPCCTDTNKNGWQDIYDTQIGGTYYQAEDTNNNGVPDYLDSDSDNDGITDLVEGCDINNDQICDVTFSNSDTDGDGLDDAFDITPFWSNGINSSGSCSSMQDNNNNWIRDWREPLEGNTIDQYEVSIFPNPSIGVFSVSTTLKGTPLNSLVLIYSSDGRLISERSASRMDKSIDISQFDNGIYFAKIQFDSHAITKRIIINK